jgi:hypothetical protein
MKNTYNMMRERSHSASKFKVGQFTQRFAQ